MSKSTAAGCIPTRSPIPSCVQHVPTDLTRTPVKKIVTIDCFPESAHLYERGYAIVAVDVLRASTTIVTSLATGRRCFPVPSAAAASLLSKELVNPLLAGEIGGLIPEGFEMNNSPSELACRLDISRPLLLLSSSGTKLIHAAQRADAVYVGCLRNLTSLSEYLARHHARIALIGAGSRGDFREEDQLACAWIARNLRELGYAPRGIRTEETLEIWSTKKASTIEHGKSAEYLRRTGQTRDLEFAIRHIDDSGIVPVMQGPEVIQIPFRFQPFFLPRKVFAGAQVGHSLR